MTRVAEAQQLARFLTYHADLLADRGYQETGFMRLAGRRLVEMASELDLVHLVDDSSGDPCPGCGGPVVQPPTGRRRTWCTAQCYERHRAAARKPRKRHDE